MKNSFKHTAWIGAGAIALMAFAGCADRNKNGQPDDVATGGEVAQTAGKAEDKMEGGAKDAANAASNVGENAANAMSNAGEKTANALSNAGEKTANAVSGVPGAIEAAVDTIHTPKIKAAYALEKALAGSKIDVDTDGKANQINLKGTVKSEAQLKLAAAIAAKNAPGFKIATSMLKVVK